MLPAQGRLRDGLRLCELCERPGDDGRGDGYSMKSRGQVALAETADEHQPWQLTRGRGIPRTRRFLLCASARSSVA